jgi:uncharacterized phage protein (TIGR01671 family)
MLDIKFRAWNSVLHEYRTLDMNSGKQNLGMGFEVTGGIGSNITTIYRSVGDVIEQYTGINDKNGVEIYKNDVVKTYAMIPGDEKYVDAVPTGVVKYYEGAYWIDNNNSALRLFQESIQIEVIGNIHENPELLGGNK